MILLIWEFFTPALADGFMLESEWQRVSISLWDSSQYSCWSSNNNNNNIVYLTSIYLPNPPYDKDSMISYTQQVLLHIPTLPWHEVNFWE